MYPETTLTPQQRADIYTQARRQAALLRSAAIADFWNGVYSHAARALRALRAAAKALTTNIPSRNPTGV